MTKQTIRRILDAARRGDEDFQGEPITIALDAAWAAAEDNGDDEAASEAEALYNDITN